jgi:hypothetical protein
LNLKSLILVIKFISASTLRESILVS